MISRHSTYSSTPVSPHHHMIYPTHHLLFHPDAPHTPLTLPLPICPNPILSLPYPAPTFALSPPNPYPPPCIPPLLSCCSALPYTNCESTVRVFHGLPLYFCAKNLASSTPITAQKMARASMRGTKRAILVGGLGLNWVAVGWMGSPIVCVVVQRGCKMSIGVL
ncbi:hypothetical protein C7974DRAFT_103226 [Boeremia exigua]|uniref:uncharacterized protein n=1 Tax=Boeremia exigua TaxID=749465 RepID=UPI001E8CA635|nr:uncharacterized protein C7974DRAFT_103226 [Boeremia exigua]KAH6642490.1 hypothetical protein C7974DRAFT_103226 [Boeremia exigua]